MQEISPTYALLMPKIRLTPIKQKTKQEEIKEIIQAPDDPLLKFPLRALGYSNEVGAALSAMPVWGRVAETALWVPALMYLGADIYDKYSRGKEGNYTKTSAQTALQQAIFQALASVILPTAAVKMGQNIAGSVTKYGATGLTATVKEEIYSLLLKEFKRYHFAKGDVVKDDGTINKGLDRVIEKVKNQTFVTLLNDTKRDLKSEGLFHRLIRFFTHTDKPVASAKADRTLVNQFLEKEINAIFERQTFLENATKAEIVNNVDSKTLKSYESAWKKFIKIKDDFIAHEPRLIIKKILNSSQKEHICLIDEISKKYPSISDKKVLIRKVQESRNMLMTLMENPTYKVLVDEFIEKIEIARHVIIRDLESKKMKLGVLKTAGGFIALGTLAVPIDHFVHDYIIKKFIEPSFDNIQNLGNKK